jgi:hypothetical protein
VIRSGTSVIVDSLSAERHRTTYSDTCRNLSSVNNLLMAYCGITKKKATNKFSRWLQLSNGSLEDHELNNDYPALQGWTDDQRI